jgi:hypothetical protein
LADDPLFVLWFMRAFVSEEEEAAINALTEISDAVGFSENFMDSSHIPRFSRP